MHACVCMCVCVCVCVCVCGANELFYVFYVTDNLRKLSWEHEMIYKWTKQLLSIKYMYSGYIQLVLRRSIAFDSTFDDFSL